MNLSGPKSLHAFGLRTFIHIDIYHTPPYPRGQMKRGLARRVLWVFYEENVKFPGLLANSRRYAGA